jgi:hypothetical protein
MTIELVKPNPSAVDLHAMDGEIVLLNEPNQTQLVIQNIPDWIENTESGNTPYALVIDPKDTKRFFAYGTSRVNKQGGLIMFSSCSALITIMPAVSFGQPGLFALTALSLAAGTYWGKRQNILPTKKFRKDAKTYNTVRPVISDIECNSLKVWLKNRYNIEVDDHTLGMVLYANIREEYGTKTLVPFTDTSGRKWILAKAETDTGWSIKQEFEELVNTSSETEKLPETADKLVHSIHANLTKVGTSADTETNYVTQRIQEDLHSAVREYRQLMNLGAETDGQQTLIEVLQLLEEETMALVDDKARNVTSALKKQHSYLKERRQHTNPNTSSLMLEKN